MFAAVSRKQTQVLDVISLGGVENGSGVWKRRGDVYEYEFR